MSQNIQPHIFTHDEVNSFVLEHMKYNYYNQYYKDEDYMRDARIIHTDRSTYLKFAIESYDVGELLKKYVTTANVMQETFELDTYKEFIRESIINAILRDNAEMCVPSREIMINVIRFDNHIVQFVCYEKLGQTHITKITYDADERKMNINTLC